MRLGYDATQQEDDETALTFFPQALAERPNDDYVIAAIAHIQTYLSD